MQPFVDPVEIMPALSRRRPVFHSEAMSNIRLRETKQSRHSSGASASIRLKTATVGRQSPFIAAAPASP